jgi:hypothetical protein
MSTAGEFLKAHGLPKEAAPVTARDIEAVKGRLPADLIAFLAEHGTGSYAKRNFWLCHPKQFDTALDALLLNVPDLRGSVAAFGYSSTGAVKLWHRAGRYFSLLLPFCILDDQTSRKETAPIPHDLADLYRLAGVAMPANADETFLDARKDPENIWNILFAAASGDKDENDIGDDGRSLAAALKRRHGPLAQNEIYCRTTGAEGFDNLASSYERLPLAEVFERLPSVVTVSRTVEAEPFPELVSQEYPIGPISPG